MVRLNALACYYDSSALFIRAKPFFEDVVLKKVYAISNATAKVGKKLVIKAGDAMLAE